MKVIFILIFVINGITQGIINEEWTVHLLSDILELISNFISDPKLGNS